MATNDFKPFAVGSNANVTSQSEYEGLAALASGFQAGKASSAQINKVLRQTSVMAYVLTQFIAETASVDTLDNGDADDLLASLIKALKINAANDFLQSDNCFSEIAQLGLASQLLALQNLGIANSDGFIGMLKNIVTITTSGTYTPTAGTKRIRVTITGGGGGGGGCQASSTSETFFGAGGGAGGTVISMLDLTQSTYTVVIGGGGSGGGGATSGNTGGTSSFSSLLAAPGGEGGGKTTATNTNGGAGGIPTTGDSRINGGYGSDGQSGAMTSGGAGGVSYFGGGGRAGAGRGVTGQAPGSGGGGAYDPTYGGVLMNGGNGAAGVCIVEEFA